MRHLWQRIFTYTLILVVVSQLAVLFLHRYSVDREEARRFISEYTRSLAAAVEGGTAAASDSVLKVFNRKRARAWMEDPSGQVVAGARSEMNRPGKSVGRIGEDGLIMLATADADWFVAAMPVNLREGPATLYILFGPPRGPGIWTLFFQGLIFVSVIGVLLAFWMARRVSGPLRSLREEVMEIASGNPERRVSVRGHDEITDVATAVNHMADNLAKHIRSMRELVANISHEMRSPLARIQVSLAMLEEDVSGNGKAESRLALINEELDHMNKLIGATLLTSKLDLQTPASMGTAVAFSELCREACRRHEPTFAHKRIRFSHGIKEGVTVNGDETLLTTLVSNLLDNAAKYTEADADVSLRLAVEANIASLTVANVHAPLPRHVMDHIFEPFYRGKGPTGNGAGLGLSLVRKIALLHGGDVSVKNDGGTVVFTACLPLYPRP